VEPLHTAQLWSHCTPHGLHAQPSQDKGTSSTIADC